jgi:hypothetical protein
MAEMPRVAASRSAAAVNGTATNTQSLTLNAGTGGAISATGDIGATTTLATLTITNSNGQRSAAA